MNRCKDCKFLDRKGQHGDYYVCALADTSDGSPWHPKYGGDRDKALAYALDSSQHGAALVVQLEFGCVQWEKAG